MMGTFPIERLTAEDALMLWPDRLWPQDIGALVVMEAGDLVDQNGRFRIEAAREAVGRRLHLVPRFRQLLYEPPRELGGPLWVDAVEFDIRDHVQARALPSPGDETKLLSTVEDLRRRRLERSRPLWEMWFLTGLPDRKIALFVRMHHCIADGMAGVATMAAFLDASPDPEPSAPEPWVPRRRPTERELLEDESARRRAIWNARLSASAHPITTARRLVAGWPAIWGLVGERPVPATSLDRVVGEGRRIALLRSDIARVKEVAHANEAKVNDVLLTAIAGGLRALLHSRVELERSDVMRIYVPVSLHQGDRSEARGNLIAQMVVSLPVATADPMTRLHQIAAATADQKAHGHLNLGKVPHRGVASRAFLKLVNRQHVNVSSADIPGPEIPLYFAGARLLEVFPMVQLLATNSLTVGAMSYAGGFNMMVVADQDGYPDLDVFTSGMQRELDALLALEARAVA